MTNLAIWLRRNLLGRVSATDRGRRWFSCVPRVDCLENRTLPSTVFNLLDDGPGSLRQAIESTPPGGIVDFQSGLTGTIVLTSGELAIGKNLTIHGPGPSQITVSGNHASRVLLVGATVSISGLGIIDGEVDGNGGAVSNGGALTLSNVYISGSQAHSVKAIPPGSHDPYGGGGGVYNTGTLSISESTIVGNRADSAPGFDHAGGGGILNIGTLTVINSTIASNVADASGWALGGGVYEHGLTNATIINSTITDNTVNGETQSGNGGGLFIGEGSFFSIMTCTIVGNRVTQNGATQNYSGGGMFVDIRAKPSTLTNSIVALNNGPDFAVPLFISGSKGTYNLIGIGEGSGFVNGVDGNLVGSLAEPLDPVVGPLKDNGGSTFTHALLSGSPAIDAGTNSGAPPTDQRGFNRPVNLITDMGAYEYQDPTTVTTLTSSANPSALGQEVTFRAAVVAVAQNSNAIPFGSDGTVSFFLDGIEFAAVSLNSEGVAELTTNQLSIGTYTISARYNGFALGDYGFDPSTSNPILQEVTPVGRILVDGGSPGRAEVRQMSTGGVVASWAPFGTSYTGAISVAVGDINGDGNQDIVVAAREGNPHVKVYDGQAVQTNTFSGNPDDALVTQFFAYGINFNVGATVALGDVNNDGYDELVTGASAGNPDTRVYEGKDISDGIFSQTTSLLAAWFSYGLNFDVGANVAVGDLNNDGFGEVITGATIGNPHVRVYSGQDIANGTFNPDGSSRLFEFFAFGLNLNLGAFVATGDVNGDTFTDLVVGASVSSPHVKVYDGHAFATGAFDAGNPDGSLLTEFFAYQLPFNVGVTVGTGNVDGDGADEIITGASVGAPHIRVVPGDSTGTLPPAIYEMLASPISGGVLVGG